MNLVIKDIGGTKVHEFAQHLSDRTIFLLRHPCAVVESVLRGMSLGLMPPPPEPEECHLKTSRTTGSGHSSNSNLSPFEKITWRWIHINQAYLKIGAMFPERTHTLIYESLKDNCKEATASLFHFLNIPLTPQTLDFLNNSTSSRFPRLRALASGKQPYFSVYRKAAPQKQWLTPEQREQICDMVVSHGFPLNEFWPQGEFD